MNQSTTLQTPPRTILLACGIALSVGWGIRGNYGHEFGAMLPGSLATLAAVLLAGRADWHRRIPFFAFFGALGWSFGGSISYGQVIGYTHSGDMLSVVYGYACLFVIGWIWAAIGGFAASLPAVLDRDRLTALFGPLCMVFLVWIGQEIVLSSWSPTDRAGLDWFDTDWLGATVALGAGLAWIVARRRVEFGSSMIIHAALGWWVGFGLLVLVLGFRMTPPRGDNWAGCLGMTAGLMWFCLRWNLRESLGAMLLVGVIGGLGFSCGQMIKLVGIASGQTTNWHSVLEQTYGFINGLGVGWMFLRLRREATVVTDEPPDWGWTELFSIWFVLVGITWLNLRKNVGTWVRFQAVPAEMMGWPAQAWFDLGHGLIGLMIMVLMVIHRRRPIAMVPENWLGRGQLIFVILLGWMVTGNFERALMGFRGQRLVTEGVIHLNALIVTILVLTARIPNAEARLEDNPSTSGRTLPSLWRWALVSLLVLAAAAGGNSAITRALHGDQPIGRSRLNIRFGPNAAGTQETKL